MAHYCLPLTVYLLFMQQTQSASLIGKIPNICTIIYSVFCIIRESYKLLVNQVNLID